MDSSRSSHIKEAQSTLATIQEMSQLLNTGLSPEALTICVRLCEAGINPEILAALVRELQKEVREFQIKQSQGQPSSSKDFRSDQNRMQ